MVLPIKPSRIVMLEQASKEARSARMLVLSKLTTIEAHWRDERGMTQKPCEPAGSSRYRRRKLQGFLLRLDVMKNRYAWMRDRLVLMRPCCGEELVALLARQRQHPEITPQPPTSSAIPCKSWSDSMKLARTIKSHEGARPR